VGAELLLEWGFTEMTDILAKASVLVVVEQPPAQKSPPSVNYNKLARNPILWAREAKRNHKEILEKWEMGMSDIKYLGGHLDG